jgi:hypothetical protein
MITNFKIFENLQEDEPEVGDWILFSDRVGVGKLHGGRLAYIDDGTTFSKISKIFYIVDLNWYRLLPDQLISKIENNTNTKDDKYLLSKYSWLITKKQNMLYWSKDIDDVLLRLKAEKYNL